MQKRKSAIIALVFALLCTLLVSGCSGKNMPSFGAENGGSFVTSSGERKLVYTASVTLSSNDVLQTATRVAAALPEGSWIETRRLDEDSAYLTLRVKTADFDAFLASLQSAGEVLSLSQSAEDVTDAYASLVRKKEVLISSRARLLQLIESESAEVVAQSILPRLTEIETSLTEIEAALKEDNERIEYATVYVTV